MSDKARWSVIPNEVGILVPWRPGCPHREASWAWVQERYQRSWQEAPLEAAVAASGPWIKATALQGLLRASSASIWVIADADVWCDGLPQAVEAVRNGAAWAIPHTLVYRLTEAATQRLMAGEEFVDPQTGDTEQPPYKGVMSGGIVVLQREVALDVPMDCRFEGWGGEDHAWGFALSTLHGDPWRGSAPLYHLWHPSQPRINRRVGSYPSEQLRRRYFSAQNDRPAMRRLVEAGRGAWPSSSPSTELPSGSS